MPFDFTSAQLTPSIPLDIEKNLTQLDALLLANQVDAVYLTSKDPFISEYVPLFNHHRYGITGFAGSTGDGIYWSSQLRAKHPALKPVTLFVDGRYHLQADQETNSQFVEVVKLVTEPDIESAVFERLSKLKSIGVGVDAERVSVAVLERLSACAKENQQAIKFINGDSILKALSLPGWKTERPIFSLPEATTGRTPASILQSLASAMVPDSLHFTCSTDDASFLMNARGYHLPYQASFLAYTFFVKNQFIVYLPSCSATCELKLDSKQWGNIEVIVIRNSIDELKAQLQKHEVKALCFNGAAMNGLLPSVLIGLFPAAKINSHFKWIIQNRTSKTAQEITSIKKAFLSSSRAISKTLRYGKSESLKKNISEKELALYLAQAYEAEGATSLSFNTICGAGPNSAIVHYGSPQTDVYFEKGQMALLDSGAYYAEGFCTDCTRGFFVGEKPEAWQKEIYTATLRAAISVFLKPMNAALSGKEVDAFVRSQVKAAGHDYLHGTGHGVGIHVHEEGIRFSTQSTYQQSPYACVSVEPGIYLKDKGGVRVENVVILQPEGPSAYRYENLSYVGYDWDLIDVTKLLSEEKIYLKSYEARCQELGTQLMDCPL